MFSNKKNQANIANQGMTLDPKVAKATVVAALLFPQIMQQAGWSKNAYFQHIQTLLNSVHGI